MTVREIARLFAYNAWATNRVFEALAALPDIEYRCDLKASHGGLRGTMTHLVAVEKIWLSRLVGKPEPELMQEREAESLAALKEVWQEVATRTARFVSRLDEKVLEKRVEYVTTEGERYLNEVRQILLHMINHSSYHRGQLAALMRQLGHEPVNTDLIAFYRHTAEK